MAPRRSLSAWPEPRPRRGGSLATWLLLGTVLVNLLGAGTVLAFLAQAHDAARASAVTTAQNLARVLDEGLSGALDRFDLALLAVVDEAAAQRDGPPDPARLDAALARTLARHTDLLALRVIDAEGHITHSSPPAEERVSYADRDYFLAVRAGATTAVSKPLFGRLTKVPILVFARRLEDREGRFVGAAVATVDLRRLAAMVSVPDLGPRGIITLRADDLSLVVRSGPGGAEAALSTAQVSDELKALRASGALVASYDARSPLDGVQRTFAYRRLARHPFHVLVGQALDDYLGAWRRQAVLTGLLLLAFIGLTSGGAWLAHRSQRALRESEARLAATFSAFPDGLNITRADTGRYVLINEGFCRQTGWSVAEVIGRTSAELDLWVEPAAREAAFRELRTRGQVDELETTFRRKDGTQLTGLLSSRTITIDDERYLLTITRDITRQRQLEAQVRQAQRLESVGRLAGGVAHDFNNMLSVILSEAALMEDDLPEGHPVREGLRQITRAGERSRDLTRQLLAFSRKQAIAPQAVSLNALVEATRPTLARLIGEDIELAFEPEPALRPVKVDPGQFDQVLVNLAANARDAMPRGGRLLLRTANATLDAPLGPDQGLPPGDYAVLTVSDEGHGMAPETMAHVFEPFFTTKGPGQGTGLGLATAYGIVRQSGGDTRVASAPDQGTTFSIYLPCTADPIEPAGTPARSTPVRGDGTVLLVEDEPLVRRSTRKLLESLGYRVLEACSGEEALALDRTVGFDLLISDVVMPGMKGPELARRLQALRPGLPVLFISGYAASVIGPHETPREGLRLLQKPFDAAALGRAVQEALASGGAARG
jgi:PAS domain S-box-containing protein